MQSPTVLERPGSAIALTHFIISHSTTLRILIREFVI